MGVLNSYRTVRKYSCFLMNEACKMQSTLLSIWYQCRQTNQKGTKFFCKVLCSHVTRATSKMAFVKVRDAL